MIIAIDGPSGAGKSSLAKSLASRLGMIYVDTGALYRTIGLYVARLGIDRSDKDSIVSVLDDISIKLTFNNGVQDVLLNGTPVGDSIRTPEIAAYASAVSAIGEVRDFLLETQRSIAKENDVIMDGRDIGTVIFPNADVKIFLTASNESRAARRYEELCAKGIKTTVDIVLNQMNERDRNDQNREIAPAVPASDAVLLDNSSLDLEATVDAALEIIQKKTSISLQEVGK